MPALEALGSVAARHVPSVALAPVAHELCKDTLPPDNSFSSRQLEYQLLWEGQFLKGQGFTSDLYSDSTGITWFSAAMSGSASVPSIP